jgi:hypothetical protein
MIEKTRSFDRSGAMTARSSNGTELRATQE